MGRVVLLVRLGADRAMVRVVVEEPQRDPLTGKLWRERNFYADLWHPAREIANIDPTPHEFATRSSTTVSWLRTVVWCGVQ